MSDKRALGDRMKRYENATAGLRHLPQLPVCARIDGKRFSKFTEGLARPFDQRLSDLMVRTTCYLVETTQACIGYTQSDEISLVYFSDDPKKQIFLDGRIQKMTSILAAMTTAYFGRELAQTLPEKADEMPLFDCRTWTVPSKEEAVNALVWREQDATKNSISMATQSYYHHSDVIGLKGAEMQELLFQKGVNWNDYPTFFKRGTYVQHRTLERRFTSEEIRDLPAKHDAHRNPDLVYTRREVAALELPPMTKITNRVEVVFDGVRPETG